MKIKKQFVFVLVIMIAGLGISSFSALWLYETEEKVLIAEFQKEVDKRAASLDRELSINLEALRSLGILFDSEQLPDYPTFKKQARRILNRHPNIQALEWIPKIPHSQQMPFLNDIRVYFPGFQISERQKQGIMVPVSSRAEYFPVYFVEPYKGNEKALGFDLSSSDKRRKTLEESRLSGLPLATASITLVQEQAKQKGFLAFLPRYNGPSETPEQRQQNLLGFVLGVYRANDIFIRSELEKGTSNIHMMLVDNTSGEPDVMSENHMDDDGQVQRSITYQKDLPLMWGRQWSVIAHPTGSYLSANMHALPYLIFSVGVIFTLLIALYASFLIRRNRIIKKKVDEKTRDLLEAQQATKDYQNKLIEMNKMASLGEMSAGIAHELSQPIGTILLKTQIMVKVIEKQDYEKCLKFLGDMKNQAIRAKEIMDSLRIISRDGKREDQAVTSASSIISNAVTLFKDEFQLNKITLNQELDDQISIFVSPVQLGQVIANLMGNARDSLRDSQDKTITIRSFISEKQAVIEIEDSGSGIPEEYRDKIFEPFFTSKPVGKGTGLGLSMCYSMIQENGGSIDFRTAINKGTCFTLGFPFAQA